MLLFFLWSLLSRWALIIFAPPFAASISVRNVFNIPKVGLTVKPDPSDAAYLALQHQQQQQQQQLQMQQHYDMLAAEYYPDDKYIRPDISFESTHDLYTQAQLQRAQELNLQQHYQLQDIDRSLATMQEQQQQQQHQPHHQHHEQLGVASPQTPIGYHHLPTDHHQKALSENKRSSQQEMKVRYSIR